MLKVYWFTAKWCGPCRQMTPGLEKIKEDYKDKIILKKVNVDEDAEICIKYGVTSIPCFIYVQDEEVMHRVVGARPLSELTKKIDELIKK